MRPAWPNIWTFAALLHSSLCAQTYSPPSVATYIDGQQIIVTLNYSTWSGYFNNQIHLATGRSTCTHSKTISLFHLYLPTVQAMLCLTLPTPVGVLQTTSLLSLRQSTAALRTGEVSIAHHMIAGLQRRAANLPLTDWLPTCSAGAGPSKQLHLRVREHHSRMHSWRSLLQHFSNLTGCQYHGTHSISPGSPSDLQACHCMPYES